MKPYEVEKVVRARLGEMFGTRFRKRKLVIGYDSAKIPQIHEFDLVSEGRDIVGEIKSGKCTRTNFNLAVVDCVYLSKVVAQTKLMVFTNKQLYDYFRNHSEGLIANNIRLILIIPDSHDVSLAEGLSVRSFNK